MERRTREVTITHSERRTSEMNCLFHAEVDKRLRTCEESNVLTKEHHEELSILFRYYESMSKDIQAIKLINKDFVLSQANQTSALGRIEGALSEHLKSYRTLEKEFNDFAWFRTQLNWLKEKLPWWCLTVIAIGIALLFVSLDLLKKIVDLFR